MAQITSERVDDYISVIRFLNAPEGFLTPGMLPALAATFEVAAHDPTIRAVVLTGGLSRVFIQHYWDPDALAAGVDPVRAAFPNRLRDLCDRIESCDKPVIAAINGTCMGGGLELALACDFRVAQAGVYSIGTTEIHLGVLPGGGGTQRLVRLLGAARALELISLGLTFRPEEAAARGLVNFCAPRALEASLALAQRLAAQPAQALAHLKKLVNRASFAAGSENEAREIDALCRELWSSQEATRRMTAFNRGEFDMRDAYPDPDRASGRQGREVTIRVRPNLRLV
jgi:enoyl-CoA hydratase/carnithine racemase